jgi:hypothetical protein
LDDKKKQRTKTRTLVFRRDLAQLEEKPENNGDEDKFDEVCVESFGHCCVSIRERKRERDLFNNEVFMHLTCVCILKRFFAFFSFFVLFFSWTS